MNQSQLISIGMMLVFIGILIIIAGTFFGAKEKANVKSAGIIFIGPFPIVGWGSNKKMYYALLILGLILFFFVMFFMKILK